MTGKEFPMKDDRATLEQLRAYRTRGWVMPLCGALTALLFCLLVPVWCTVYAGIPPYYLLLLGVLLSAVAIPFHLAGGKRRKKQPQVTFQASCLTPQAPPFAWVPTIST